MNDILTCDHFLNFPRLVHGFTTRSVGFDTAKIAEHTKISQDKIFHVEQVHGDNVVIIDEKTRRENLPPADALVTNLPGILIGVRTADCLPILLYDSKKQVVAAIHAGYKGILSDVILKTLTVLMQTMGCRLENLNFVFGPAICVAHYEVGDEVIAAFRERFGVRFAYDRATYPKPHLDIAATARMTLEDEGLFHRNFTDLGLCTFENEELFYSHRRQKDEGRQFNFIGMI